jgi:YHS domain-containing protein
MTYDQVNDPVCGMRVDRHSNEIVYQDLHFAFCSVECKNRFLAHPHLYVGFPNQPAPKQLGLEVLKRRRLRLPHALSPEGRLILTNYLEALRGIKQLTVDGDMIEISYDLLQLSAEQIETALHKIGVSLGEGWSERLIRAFVRESEEWEISSLEVTPPRRSF